MEVVKAYVGVDWASATHFVYILDADGKKLGDRMFSHTGDGLAEMASWIRRTTGADPSEVAVGIEVPHGPVVESLMDAGFRVHALNPKQLDRFRDRFTIAGAKDDRRDALVLADALRTDSRFYRYLEPMHPTIVHLREWSRMAEELSAERNRLTNRLRHQLWRYYPQFNELSEDCAKSWFLDLWELVPTPAKARSTRPGTIAKLISRSRVRRWDANGITELLRRTPIRVAEGVTDACVAHCRLLIERIRVVNSQHKEALVQLERLSKAVAEIERVDDETVSTRHCDPEILRSLPGVGPIVLAALLSESYDAICRRDAQALRGLAGVAPVTRRSGKQHIVVMRQACPQRLRTAVYHWARVAVMRDFHSRNRYAALRKRGHSHARALRSVGSRLIGVACAMLETGELFDPDRAPQMAMSAAA